MIHFTTTTLWVYLLVINHPYHNNTEVSGAFFGVCVWMINSIELGSDYDDNDNEGQKTHPPQQQPPTSPFH